MIAIVGVGATEYVRRSEASLEALVVDACLAAIADAGLEPSDIDGIVTEGSLMPTEAPPDVIAAALGLGDRRFTAHGPAAGPGIVGAPALAQMAIDSGTATHVLSYFGTSWGSAVSGPYGYHARDATKAAFEMPFGYYGQPVYFGGLAQRYAHEYGLADTQLAAVALAARANAQRTPGAMRTDELTLEAYRAEPMIATPLRRADCCLLTDGASAFVMTASDRARALAQPPVTVAGVGIGSPKVSGTGYFTQNDALLTTAAAASGPRALQAAGLELSDVDFLELYDCFTISTILQLEDLGFCAKGEGAAFVEDGALATGGRLPTNTHGGLLSHSYTLGAHHVVEAVEQLRHSRGEGQVEGAEVGLVTGLGSPDHATLILTVDR